MSVWMFISFCWQAPFLRPRSEIIENHAKDAFRLLNEWRKDVIPEYLFAYGVPEDYVLLPQKYGMMLCCVEKAFDLRLNLVTVTLMIGCGDHFLQS